MSNRSITPKRPRDTNQLAKRIVDLATSDKVDPKQSAKASAGQVGGRVGGRTRAERLTKERRSEIARKAAAARWTAKKG